MIRKFRPSNYAFKLCWKASECSKSRLWMFGLYLWLLHWETKLGLNPFSKPETKTPLSEFISDLHDIFIYENGTDIENGERCPEDCICDGDIIAIASRMLARGWTKKSETKTPTASADEKGNGND